MRLQDWRKTGGHEEVKTGSGWGGTGRMRMGQGVAREDSSERHSVCQNLIIQGASFT